MPKKTNKTSTKSTKGTAKKTTTKRKTQARKKPVPKPKREAVEQYEVVEATLVPEDDAVTVMVNGKPVTYYKSKAGERKKGRPTSYHPIYCDVVCDLMAEGASKEEVAQSIGICYQTFLNWQVAHEDFLEAVKEGEKLSEAWWNRLGRLAAAGKVDGFSPVAYIFNMKNRFKWQDKVEPPKGERAVTKLTFAVGNFEKDGTDE